MNKLLIRGTVSGAIVLLLLLVIFRNHSPFGRNNTSFGSEPKNEITKVELSNGKERLTLTKEGDNWVLNGKSQTRKSGVLFLIRILKDIKIKSPVSQELFNSEITAKGIVPVKVKVYENRKVIRSFLVYKTQSNNYGNIMMMRAGAKPFIVYMPGYEGDIGSGFTLNELFWQPYTIFNLLPSEIASVDFENFADTTNSFSILNKDHRFILSDRGRSLTGWDSALVTRYLSYFTRIPFESWAFDIGKAEQEKIESDKPLYRITLTSSKGIKTILTLWEKSGGLTDRAQKDSDRLFGKTQARNELFIIRYFDVDPILKKRSYFYPQ